jgi:hypothetical protein
MSLTKTLFSAALLYAAYWAGRRSYLTFIPVL